MCRCLLECVAVCLECVAVCSECVAVCLECVAVCDWTGLQPGADHTLPEHRETAQGYREPQR
jgi:hypothetical protein